MRAILRQFRDDLRRPLPDAEHLSRRERFVRRMRYLVARHGWRLVVTLLVYYIIRDVILYLLLPYLAATHIFAD